MLSWRRWIGWSPPLLSRALALLVVSWCAVESAAAARSEKFVPTQSRTLRSFGAVGDARADDTAALARALAGSDRYCLNGEGKTYRVWGTLRATKSLCLRDAALEQVMPPFETRPYLTGECPRVSDASAQADCGDRAIPADLLPALIEALHVRTLLIMPDRDHARVRVNLERVKVDRGRYSEGGSRTDAAGIWLVGAERVDFRDVEITGHGKGFGLFLMRSQNVTLTNLTLRDLAWTPYAGDAVQSLADVAELGWNKVSIREVRVGSDGARFYATRVQEQLTCAYLAEVRNVVIRNASIHRCTARLKDSNLPWQTDGLTIGGRSSNITIDGARIDTVWEGIDVVGSSGGVCGLEISDLRVSNAFAFGLKLGQVVLGTRVSGMEIASAGLAGVILSGPVSDTLISQAYIANIGTIALARGSFAPWPAELTAAIRIEEGQGGNPTRIAIHNVAVSNGAHRRSYDFGILNQGGQELEVTGFQPSGFGRQQMSGASRRR